MTDESVIRRPSSMTSAASPIRRLLSPALGTGAGLVITHTLARPKQRLQSSTLYVDIVKEVASFLSHKADAALSMGLRWESLRPATRGTHHFTRRTWD